MGKVKKLKDEYSKQDSKRREKRVKPKKLNKLQPHKRSKKSAQDYLSEE